MSQAADMLEIIATKRDGRALDAVAMEAVVRGAVTGDVPDYQLTALLMAIFLRGLDVDESAALTRAIAGSGDVIDFSDLGPAVDKHSTGGVGDTVSFIAGPIAAACGVVVPMISGRALAHTGGTLDKLESIPGLRTALDIPSFRRAVEVAGIAIVEAGPTLAPGDAVLYRLRDASATIAEQGLITASIFGKKLCVTPRGLVMDLKVGRGGFLADQERARALAACMEAVAPAVGLQVRYVLSDMQTPLSSAIGNAVEIERSIRVLRGEAGDGDLHGGRLRTLSLAIAGEMVVLAGLAPDRAAGQAAAAAALTSGRALEVFGRMIDAQGGDPRVIDDPARLPAPTARDVLRARADGYIVDLDARRIGEAAALLGVGRGQVGARVDPAAGLRLTVQIGDRVRRGDGLAELGAGSPDLLQRGCERLSTGIRIGTDPPPASMRTILIEQRPAAG